MKRRGGGGGGGKGFNSLNEIDNTVFCLTFFCFVIVLILQLGAFKL